MKFTFDLNLKAFMQFWRLETLTELNIGHCIPRFTIESITRHALPPLLATHFVYDLMKKALRHLPRAVTGYIQVCYIDSFFYSDSSLIDVTQGLLFIGQKRVVLAIRYRVQLVFLELTALFVKLRHIGEVIQTSNSGKMLDLRSVRTFLSR
jgi:hypothetical protein